MLKATHSLQKPFRTLHRQELWHRQPCPQLKATVSHLSSVATILPTFSGLTKISIEVPTSFFRFHGTYCPQSSVAYPPCLRHEGSLSPVRPSSPLSMLNSCKNRNVEATLDVRLGTRYDKESQIQHVSFPPFKHISVKDCSGTDIMAWIQTAYAPWSIKDHIEISHNSLLLVRAHWQTWIWLLYVTPISWTPFIQKLSFPVQTLIIYKIFGIEFHIDSDYASVHLRWPFPPWTAYNLRRTQIMAYNKWTSLVSPGAFRFRRYPVRCYLVPVHPSCS